MGLDVRQRMLASIVTGLVAWGAAGVVSVHAQAWEPSALPEAGGMISLVGCFQRGGPHNEWVLTNPTTNPVTSVTQGTCAAPYNELSVELKDMHDHFKPFAGQ